MKKVLAYLYVSIYDLKNKTIGKFQVFWWNRSSNFKVIFAISLFLFSLFDIKEYFTFKENQNFDFLEILRLFLGVLSFILFVYLLVKGFFSQIEFNFSSMNKKFGYLHDKIVIDKLSDFSLNIFKPKNQAIVFSKKVNANLEKGNNDLVLMRESYELPFIVKHFSRYLIKELRQTTIWRPTTTNDNKVRLSTEINVDVLKNNKEISIQKTNYFNDRLSNTLANYQVDHNNDEFINLRKHFVLHEDKSLVNLTDSKLSNQLGGSSILICKDGIALLTQNNTNENPDSLSPSGSGSFDFDKPGIFKTFQEFAKHESRRELMEECGLLKEDIEIQLCGYGKYIYRNGKPEVFCIASTAKSWNELNPSLHERLYQKKEIKKIPIKGQINKFNTIAVLDMLIKSCEEEKYPCQNANGPLYWSLVFANDYLKNHISLDKEAKLFSF